MNIVDLRHIFGSRPYPDRPLGWINSLIVHHSEGRTPIGDWDARSAISEIDSFHRGPQRGWPGIAYHWAIWWDTLYLLRDFDRQGWHSAGMDVDPRNGIGDGNDHGVAVVLLGTYTAANPDARTIQTIRETWEHLESELGRHVHLTGHQDWWATGCPGNGWNTWKWHIAQPGVPAEPDDTEDEDVSRIAELEAERDGLVTALADVCDVQGDRIAAEVGRVGAARKRPLREVLARMRDVRRQFLGPRP